MKAEDEDAVPVSVSPFNPADPLDPSSPVNPASPVDHEGTLNPAGTVVPVIPLTEEQPMRTWLWPTLIIFGLVVGVALLVMILVSTADFGSDPAQVTPTPDQCQTFCTTTVAPPSR
ncbi:hypothetical protein [Nocardia jinanensis]|uniref:Uncharacterized protein n=1 Tax=Nocardia jinanensis TaxID=382504 RepID=A0A917R6M4_9NOCA|nr:hypothetical protein [Nocardia jinanensis]GGK91874.1 hypothetical protein GCM10011588_02830 [Nocardia jinanensis]